MTNLTKLFEPNIEVETYIARSPADVFDAITTASIWDKWFTSGMKLEPRVGGKIHFRWENWGPQRYSGEDFGDIQQLEAPHLFAFRWHGNSSIPMTTVTFRLETLGTGTHVRLSEEGYLDNKLGRGWLLSCSSGWGEALALLKMYLEHGVVYTRRPAE